MAALVLAAALPAYAVPDTSPLALPERRALQTYQASTYPGLQARIQQAAEFEAPVQVQRDAIAVRGQAASYNEADCWTNVIFLPIEGALRSIAVTYDPATAPASAYERGSRSRTAC